MNLDYHKNIDNYFAAKLNLFSKFDTLKYEDAVKVGKGVANYDICNLCKSSVSGDLILFDF